MASVPAASPGPQGGRRIVLQNAYTVVDLPLAELLADLPELQGLKPAADQQELPAILSKVRTTVEQLYQNLPALPVRLPQEVTVATIYNGRMYRNQHLYSNFKRFVVHSEI